MKKLSFQMSLRFILKTILLQQFFCGSLFESILDFILNNVNAIHVSVCTLAALCLHSVTLLVFW